MEEKNDLEQLKLEVKHFDSNDVRIEGNPTLDEKLIK